MVSVQDILDNLDSAIAGEEFQVYFQPQYNHSTGMIIGAEALVRWVSPRFGFVSPADFIPVLEEQGRVPEIDLYVFEHVCRFLRHSLDMNLPRVRISVNMSRNDVLCEDFIDRQEALRQKYDVPTSLIHVELTESAAIAGSQVIIDAIDRLHSLGYTVEMDDFGSGYSSLNVLKDINFDVLKLDLKFIAGSIGNERGGTILSSVVRMAKWLRLPVIAEGVETVEQADFLRSVGCDYIQGYLYSKPVPAAEYEKLLKGSAVGSIAPQLNLSKDMDAGKFWNPDSWETLIFSNFVGPAAIMERRGDQLEILRVNQKFLREMGMNLSENDLVSLDAWATLDDENKIIYKDTLDRAVETRSEQECETWRTVCSKTCGNEKICIHSTIQLIGESKISQLFYVMIRNVTVEKLVLQGMKDAERRFKMASEQANIYYWEYIVASKEMRPCFRCQRDLGLPPLVRNYPEPLIENGIFPEDYADMYRDILHQIEGGAKRLEVIVPMTPERTLFHIRYTTEFDENGRPVRAYGSATKVVDK